MMADDHEFALEQSVQNIDDTNESDEELESMSVMSGYSERLEEEGRNGGGGGGAYRSLHQQHNVPTISLKNILEDERSFTLFRRFLKDQCISRNLQFWLACEHYRSQPYDKIKLMESAKAIYSRFLGSSAPLHVSVMDGTKRSIQLSVQLKAEPDINLFRQAQLEVYQQMQGNELRQFLLSDSFSDCSQFNKEEGLAFFSQPETFQPARYRGGSLHSGSDDSTSITSFNSEDMGGTVLCVPPRVTRLNIIRSPRNAHSDTEHCSSSSRHGHGKTTFFSRGKSLTAREFYEILYERLVAVDKDRANLQRRARNIAREGGKTYEDIMSLDWFDAPEAVKYVKFDEEGGGVSAGSLKPMSIADHGGSPIRPQEVSNGVGSTSHIASMAAKEIQEALKDLEITRQVRQKRNTSVMSTSSASSYISDSGVGESLLPSSGSGSGLLHRTPHRVQAYLQNQHRVTSQLSDREQKAQLAATMLINNSTHQEDLNPNGRHPYHNYPGAYSSDDSSSCFTTTTQSSNSEFFIPRRTNSSFYTDSDDSRHHSRYPQGMRRVNHHKRSTHNSTHQTPMSGTAQPRYFPPNQQHHHHPSPNAALPPAPPPQQQQQQPPSRADVSPAAVHTGDMLLVAYTMEGYPNTMAKRIPLSQLTTLADFKEKVFKRKGCFRFFFKTFCEDLNQEIMEEISDDVQLLPHFQGKIIGHVEKAEADS